MSDKCRDQVRAEERFVRCLGQLHNEVSKADIFLAGTLGKDPIDLQHLGLDLPVLHVNVIRKHGILPLLDDLVHVFLYGDGGLLTDHF